MRTNGKKIILVILILLILTAVTIGVIGFVLTKNGILAITKEQKIAKGLIEIEKNINRNFDLERIPEFTNSNATRTTTTISTTTDTMKLKYFEGYDSIIDEIKEMINNLQVKTVIEKDLSNKIINSSFEIKDGNVLKSLSGEFSYNEDVIGMRIKELNEKYIVVKKEDTNYQENGTTVFNYIDNRLKESNYNNLKFTEEEKQYFIDNYKEIITNNITAEMIKSEKAVVNINGKEENCTRLYVELDKEKIAIIIGEILQKLEGDSTGKDIIISKIKAIGIDFTETDIYSIIKNIRTELAELEESTNVKLTMFSTYTRTLGYSIEIFSKNDVLKINNMFEENYNFISVNSGNDFTLNIIKNGNIVDLTLNGYSKENTISLNYNQIGGIGKGSIQIENPNNNTRIDIDTDVKDINNTTGVFKVEYKSNDDNVVITFNINNKIEEINNISSPTYNYSNSIEAFNADDEAIGEYLREAIEGLNNIIVNATENSRLIRSYYNYYKIENYLNLLRMEIEMLHSTNRINEDVSGKITSQAVQLFNSQFTYYEGIQRGSTIKNLYDVVTTSNITNADNGHQVIIESNFQKSEIDNTKQYKVELGYNNDGYINMITITLYEQENLSEH